MSRLHDIVPMDKRTLFDTEALASALAASEQAKADNAGKPLEFMVEHTGTVWVVRVKGYLTRMHLGWVFTGQFIVSEGDDADQDVDSYLAERQLQDQP